MSSLQRQSSVESVPGDDEDQIKIRQITAEILDQFMEKSRWRTQRHKHLTFRSEVFRLQSADGLLEQPIDLTRLLSLDLSNNDLVELHCVEGRSKRLDDAGIIQGNIRFQSLVNLKARHNQIDSFVTVLPSLRELDLSHNRLTKMPPLAGMPHLEVLLLSHNNMEGSWLALDKVPQMKKLDLSGNDFKLKPSKFMEEIEVLAQLQFLVSLKVKNNPFGTLFPEYQSFIFQKIPSLEKLDDIDDMEDIRKVSKLMEKKEYVINSYDSIYCERHAVARDDFEGQDKAKQASDVPNLADLMDPLIDAIEDPTTVEPSVTQLMRMCTAVTKAAVLPKAEEAQAQLDRLFDMVQSSDKTQPERNAEIEAHIRTFLANYRVLFARIQGNDSWRAMMLRCLARLCVIKSYHFGEMCIKELAWLQQKDVKLRDEVLKIMQEIVIAPLGDEDYGRGHGELRQIGDPRVDAVIAGLAAYFQPTTPAFAEALFPIMPWLVATYCKEKRPQKDITFLLATALSNEANREEAMRENDTKLAEHVSQALENKQLYKNQNWALREQYIGHLRIVQYTAFERPRIIETTYSSLHQKLLDICKDFMLGEGSAGGPPDLSQLKVIDVCTCSALLDCLVVMMSNRTAFQQLTDSRLQVSIVDLLLLTPMQQNPSIDPQLLAASTRGIRELLQKYLLESASIRDKAILRIITDIDYAKKLLQMLDPDVAGGAMPRRDGAYAALFFAAQRHMKELSELRRTGSGRSAVDNQDPPKLSELLNPLIHDCFIAIVELVTFFTKENDNKQCAVVNGKLNDNRRDRILIQLLQVPSVELQSAVATCLKEVKMEEFSPEEIQDLLVKLRTKDDISSEEELLFNVVQTLRKITESTGSSMRGPIAGDAVSKVMEVLRKNAKRLDQGKSSTKEKLSKECVALLQKASTKVDFRTNGYLRTAEVNQGMCEVLQCEDEQSASDAPNLLVERTWTGRSIEALLQCISGARKLKVKGKVAFRVVSRIADVLEGRPLNSGGGAVDQSQSSIEGIAAEEQDMWDPEKIEARLRRLQETDNEKDILMDRFKQQKIFVECKGITRIMLFVSGLYDQEERRPIKRDEIAKQEAADQFLKLAKTVGKKAQEEAERADGLLEDPRQGWLPQQGGGVNASQDDVQSEEGSENGGVDNTAVIEWDGLPEGQKFTGDDDYGYQAGMTQFSKGIDLKEEKYKKGIKLGGPMSILVTIRWDALQRESRVIEFGNDTEGPKDSIIICNDRRSNNLVFMICNGNEEKDMRKLTVQNHIQVSTSGPGSRYLFSVDKAGVMKIFKEGATGTAAVIGETAEGIVPRQEIRKHLFVGGKTEWTTGVEPFQGMIKNLKVWRKAMDWDNIREMEKDSGEATANQDADSEDGECEGGRRYFIQELHTMSLDEHRPVREDLLGGLDQHGNALPSRLSSIKEELWIDDEANFNPAYILAATWRCLYVIIKFAATDDFRKSAIDQLIPHRNHGRHAIGTDNSNVDQSSPGIMVSRMISLMGVAGMFDCNAAAKFCLLLTTMLEHQPEKTYEEADRIVVFHILHEYLCRISHETVLACKHHQNRQLAERGRVVATEIARFMCVVCRNIEVIQAPDEILHSKARMAFIEVCLERLVPSSVVRSIIDVILHDPLLTVKAQYTKGDSDELLECARLLIAALLDRCPVLKYDVLEAFSQIMVSKAFVNFRRTFLSSILAESVRSEVEKDLEEFLDKSDRLKKQRGRENPNICQMLKERTVLHLPDDSQTVLMSAKVEVIWRGQPQTVSDYYSRDTPCFNVVVTNHGMYLADMTKRGFPQEPEWLCNMWHADLTRIVKGVTPQMLHIGYVDSNLSEEYLTLICHNSRDCKDLLDKLLVLSQQPAQDSSERHRVPYQTDNYMDYAIFKKTGMDVSKDMRHLREQQGNEAKRIKHKITWVYKLQEAEATSVKGAELLLLILAEGTNGWELHELRANFEYWRPPSDTDMKAFIGGVGAVQLDEPAAAPLASGPGADKSDADLISEERNNARDDTQKDTARPGNSDKAWEDLIRRAHASRKLGTVIEHPEEDVVLSQDKQFLRVRFKDDGAFCTFAFLDDIERTTWGREFLLQASASEDEP